MSTLLTLRDFLRWLRQAAFRPPDHLLQADSAVEYSSKRNLKYCLPHDLICTHARCCHGKVTSCLSPLMRQALQILHTETDAFLHLDVIGCI